MRESWKEAGEKSSGYVNPLFAWRYALLPTEAGGLTQETRPGGVHCANLLNASSRRSLSVMVLAISSAALR
jgi:hypothetical protein